MDPGNKFECPMCSKPFKTKQRFDKHVVTHEPNAKKKCEICGKILKNLVTLAAHVRRIHTSRERRSCDLCHRNFCDSRNLLRHMDAMHGSEQRTRFPCEYPGCAKTYLNQRHLWGHAKTEHAENPVRFPCTLCGKEFKCRTNLEFHIRTHTTEKPFKYTTCAKNFALSQKLKQHELTHLPKFARKIFKCKICTMTFLESGGLRKNIRVVHENERNYECTFCDKKFSRSCILKNHVDAVHPANKEKIHACNKCEYRSHSKRNLDRHKIRHGVKTHA